VKRYRRLLRYPMRQRRRIGAIVGLTILMSLLAALQPWPLKVVLDYAVGDAPIPGVLRSLLDALGVAATAGALLVVAALASLAIFALTSAVDASLAWTWVSAGERMVYDIAADLFHRLQRLSLLFHGRRSVGDSLSRLTGDSWAIYTVTGALLVTPVQSLFTVVTLTAVMWGLDPALAILSLSIAPFLAAGAWFFGGRMRRRSRLNREAQSKLMSFTHQVVTSIPVVQAFGSEPRNARTFDGLAREAVARRQHEVVVSGSFKLLTGLISAAGLGLVLYVGGTRVLGGALSVGSLVVFLAYVRTLQGAFGTMLRTFAELKSAEASIERVLEILDTEEMVRDLPGAAPLPEQVRGHVRLEAVTFGYEPGRPVLHGIDLEALPGETVALVGRTGSGKSTLVSLIPRFFDPWEGRVTLGGRDVREVPLADLRSRVALVLQEPFLLPLTVAENIAYGREGATPEQVRAAARAANADSFIRNLPAGYDTVIGERGATLSGGEKQRIAIARALLKDAPVLILDEPTSALDAQTESLLLEALERLMAGRTTFIIAHRLSTIRRADRIAVVEEGRIVEEGSHAELMERDEGIYRRSHQLQLVTGATEASG